MNLGGYEDMKKSKFKTIFNDDIPITPRKHLAQSTMGESEVDCVISNCIYHGDIDLYLDHVIEQGELTEEQVYQLTRDPRRLEKTWHVASSIFSLSTNPPIVPENIRLAADSSQKYGERIVLEREEIDTRVKSRARAKLAKLAGRSKKKQLVKKLVRDENITQNIYTFPNTFSFTWNVATCPEHEDLPGFLDSVANFIG